MAVRQYIGARYVPLYVGDWDQTRNYEPLSIVTDANGNSFTSLKDVPAGTALTDREYWIQTSSFSGAVDQLQRRMNNAEDEIENIEENVSEIGTRIDGVDTRLDGIDSSITTLDNKITALANKAVFLGNSYAIGVNNVEGLYERIKHLYGDSVLYHASGCSVLPYTNNGNRTYKNLVASAAADSSKLDVIILAAVGDERSMQEYATSDFTAAFRAGLAELEGEIRTKFPNVNNIIYIKCSAMPTTHVSTDLTASRQMDIQAEYWMHCMSLRDLFYGSGIKYAGWAGWDVMYNANAFQNDKIHPNETGMKIIANNIEKILSGYGMQYAPIRFIAYSVNGYAGQGISTTYDVKFMVYPEYSYWSVRGVGSTSAGDVGGQTVDPVVHNSNMPFVPPIGYYQAAGGTLAGRKNIQNIVGFGLSNCAATDSFFYDSDARTPHWARTYFANQSIVQGSRMNRVPMTVLVDHYPSTDAI